MKTDFDKVLAGENLKKNYRNVMGIGKALDDRVLQRNVVDSMGRQKAANEDSKQQSISMGKRKGNSFQLNSKAILS